MTKRVRWEIDVEANTPEDAARQALAIQHKPDSTATVFDVTDEHGRYVRVDLARPDAAKPLTCDNCGRHWCENDLRRRFPDIPDLLARIEPGGTVPAGECPGCGALVYPDRPVARVLILLQGGLVEDIHADIPGLRAAVLDLDCEGVEPEELVEVPNDGEPLRGTLHEREVLDSPALLAEVARLLPSE